MASLSEKLRRERELRGISLKQISDDTKIGVRFLEALEEDRLELIPGEFYRRSYLRAYARYLGLDEDRAVNAYAYANQEKEPDADDEERKAAGMAPWLPWVLGACALFIVVVLYLRSNPPESASNQASVANAATGDERSASPEPKASDAPPPEPTPRSNDVPVLAPASNGVPELSPARGTTSGPPPVASPTEGALRFVVSVSESCWLEIEADGEIVTTGLKEEGYRRAFSADTEVRLWLGNAGGVVLWVNDRPLRSLGQPGQVRKDVSITPANYLDFVSAGDGSS